MKHEANILPLTLLLALAGCSGDAEKNKNASSSGTTTTDASTASTTTDGGTTTGGGPSTCVATGTTMVPVTAEMNYTFSSTLTFPPISVMPDTELTFDWSTLTRDFLGHPLDASTEIIKVNLMLWTMTQGELETRLNADTLTQSDLAIIAFIDPESGQTDANLFSFLSGAGMPLETEMILPFVSTADFPPEENIYTAIAASSPELGAGSRMIQAFKLDPNSTNTVVDITDTSTDLQYTVELEALQAIAAPPSDPSVVIDWTNLKTNGLGGELIGSNITKLAIARYDSKTPAELEEDFLSLVNYDGSVNADQLWEADVKSGTCISLADATDATGAAFPGIDATSTWMVALFCGNCRNPAPWFLSFLTPG